MIRDGDSHPDINLYSKAAPNEEERKRQSEYMEQINSIKNFDLGLFVGSLQK